MNISVDDHPLLDPVLFRTLWPAPLGELDTLPDLARWFSGDAVPPIDRPDDVKAAVRDLLRHGGFKPSGRSKPASEYLVKAAERGVMGSINPAVDCCNVASLWSGLPISVVDVDKGEGPWRVGLAASDTVYVFNPSGQDQHQRTRQPLRHLRCMRRSGEGQSANQDPRGHDTDPQHCLGYAGTERTQQRDGRVVWRTHVEPGGSGRADHASKAMRSSRVMLAA